MCWVILEINNPGVQEQDNIVYAVAILTKIILSDPESFSFVPEVTQILT